MEFDVLIVETLLKAVPGCQAIYRFGSWGSEAQRPDSDLDLAILPPEKLDPVRRWELSQELASLVNRDVDLVDLLAASTVMRMQVIAYGQRLYAAELNAAEEFETMVFSSYARLNEERREILQDVQQRGRIYDK